MPAVFVSLCAVGINFVEWPQLRPPSSGGTMGFDGVDEANQRCAITWFIVMFAGCLACIGGSIWIFVQDFNNTGWPGISLLIQVNTVTVAALLFFFARGVHGKS